MRTALHVLTDELRRLKASGVKSVSVSDDGIAALRRVVQARAVGAKPPVTVTAPTLRADLTSPPKPYEPSARAAVKSTPPAEPTMPPPPRVSLPAGDKAVRMAALRDALLVDPVVVARLRPGKRVVSGVGSVDAKIMFVGDAPGPEEEDQGEPFVGPAGQLLTKMIGAMGLARADVYLASIMNWRTELPNGSGMSPSDSRAPTEEEIRYCLPFLQAQIEIVQPTLIVALGVAAAQGLLGLGTFKTLGDIRGRWGEFTGKPLMVTYHPSYILRNQSNRSKRMIWEDLLKVMERASLPIAAKQRVYFLDK